jgi:AcrR family transcriptional regulator
MTELLKPEKKLDRRVVRTRRALRDALMQLILEKDYHAILVQDITDRADLARATFYLHYKDKDELLYSSQEEIFDELVERMKPFAPTDEIERERHVEMGTIVFRHVQAHADFYRVMLGERGVSAFIVRVRHYIAARWLEMVIPLLPPGHVTVYPLDAIAHQQAGAMLAVIGWWLENDMPLPPERVAEIDHDLGLWGCSFGIGLHDRIQPAQWAAFAAQSEKGL